MNSETANKLANEAKSFFSKTEGILDEGASDFYERANRIQSDLSESEREVLKSAYWFIMNVKHILANGQQLDARRNFGAL